MRDYIERNRLKTVIEKNFGHGTISPILQLIDQQPIADVVEVVRCKDCKWNKSTPHNPICSNDDMPKDVGFFCADGRNYLIHIAEL